MINYTISLKYQNELLISNFTSTVNNFYYYYYFLLFITTD